MIEIFLSASVPLPQRNRIFFDTADILAIRESIKALVEVILPVGRITCGGHPAITPLLALFVREADLSSDHVTIYQSRLFNGKLPPELENFVDVRMTDAVGNDIGRSLTAMRQLMIASRPFDAAVIIGGMEGIYEEYDLFRASHPNAKVLPVPTTGAAAAIVHRNGGYDEELARERTYSSLFRRRLISSKRLGSG
ncbi:hypothetical protein [Methylobacterium sp. J-077]|uniref:SLOG domain-containing protein n=1 Tax=Methylobacterium sp. J-077 TaxID=2836656 RepID=UPI001FBBF7B1|nr:hypothetical protein [Methylobacterium sp. J-077]MCJ2121271.1 hypothetical protein [Methylobacterium sp. J-077]